VLEAERATAGQGHANPQHLPRAEVAMERGGLAQQVVEQALVDRVHAVMVRNPGATPVEHEFADFGAD
jgi:hypothetical protein